MKGFLFSCIYFCLFAFSCSATIVHTPNLEVIEPYLDQLDPNSLVLLDVDYTILVFKDRALGHDSEKYYKPIMKKLKNRDDINYLTSSIFIQAEYSLIDQKILTLIEKLQNKNIKVIALTAIPSGSLGLIPHCGEWRFNQLLTLGINFESAFPTIQSLSVQGFPETRPAPLYTKGVLASGGYPKGQVIRAFLKQIEWTPSNILFVDDRLDYINSVEEELEKENIPHTSFHYTAVVDHISPINEKLADFQFNYLLETDIWLNDEKALKKMNEN